MKTVTLTVEQYEKIEWILRVAISDAILRQDQEAHAAAKVTLEEFRQATK